MDLLASCAFPRFRLNQNKPLLHHQPSLPPSLSTLTNFSILYPAFCANTSTLANASLLALPSTYRPTFPFPDESNFGVVFKYSSQYPPPSNPAPKIQTPPSYPLSPGCCALTQQTQTSSICKKSLDQHLECDSALNRIVARTPRPQVYSACIAKFCMLFICSTKRNKRMARRSNLAVSQNICWPLA